MIFDVAVWSHVPRTTKDATFLYKNLCEGDTSVLQPHPDSETQIQTFLRELTKRYPPMDAFTDDTVDRCVWNSEWDISDAHVIMTMAYSRAAEVLPSVAQLAAKDGLVCYNPQSTAVRLPPRINPK